MKNFDQIDKEALRKEAIDELNSRLSILVSSAFDAKEASTNPESKAENKYDTRGLEASYLAAGQAQRAVDLKRHIFQVEQVPIVDLEGQKVRAGALVQLSIEGDDDKVFFILPVGGINLEKQGLSIQTLTIEAPLGQQLFNKIEGDDFDFKFKEYSVVRVR